MRIALAALLVLWMAPALRGDVIVLKNGNSIRGRVIAESEQSLHIELPYGTMTILRRQIAEVRRESDDEFLRKTGEELLEGGEWERAIDYLRGALVGDPDSSVNRAALVRALTEAIESAIAGGRLQRAAQHLEAGRDGVLDAATIERFTRAIAEHRERLEVVAQEARKAQEAKNHGGALELFRELRDKYPEDRERWRRPLAESALLAGHAALREKRFEQAEACYIEALRHEPDWVQPLAKPLAYTAVQNAIPALQAGEFRAARLRLLAVFQLLPQEPAIVYHLGLALEGEGNLSDAARMYSVLAGPERRPIHGARHLTDLRIAAEEKLGIAPGSSGFQPSREETLRQSEVLETKHFVIVHRNPELAAEAGVYLEHHLLRLLHTWFAGMPSPDLRRRIEVHLHGSAAALHEVGDVPSWSDGYTMHERRYGVALRPRIHFNAASPQLFTAVLPHELAHGLLPHRLGAATRIPLWLDEGIAANEESPVKRAYYDRLVRDADADGVLPACSFLFAQGTYPEDRASVELFYAQSASVVAFLIDQQGQRNAFATFATICTYPIDEALRTTTSFANSAEFEAAWLRWVRS